ncbi:MAG: hypothetical protein Phog2KO_44940 [Phototrophicaceae bacterium]
MKNKISVLIISGVIFISALLAGLLIILMLLVSANDDATVANAPSSDTQPLARQSNPILSDNSNFVYLYDEQNSNLIRIYLDDGTEEQFSLNVPLDGSVYSSNLSFSDDGRLVAYCLTDYEQADKTFIVRDIEAEENLLALSFGSISGCQVSDFNDTGTEVTLNLVINSPIENSLNFPNEPNWALRTIDIASGRITQELNADSANAPDYESMRETFWFEDGISAMTRAIHYGENEILMTAFPYVGRGGPLRVPAHRWNFADDNVTAIEGLTYLGASYLPETNEIVYPYLDEDYPAEQPPGPMPLANSIGIDDGNSIRTIYRNGDRVIANVSFINGGRQIATLLMAGADENNPSEIGRTRYEIINRDGSTGQVSTDFNSNNQIFGTQDGFLMLSISQLGAEGNVHEIVSYRDGAMTTIWSYTPPQPHVWLGLVWSPPMTTVDNLAPFVSID